MNMGNCLGGNQWEGGGGKERYWGKGEEDGVHCIYTCEHSLVKHT
jgi:hypothetical protein